MVGNSVSCGDMIRLGSNKNIFSYDVRSSTTLSSVLLADMRAEDGETVTLKVSTVESGLQRTNLVTSELSRAGVILTQCRPRPLGNAFYNIPLLFQRCLMVRNNQLHSGEIQPPGRRFPWLRLLQVWVSRMPIEHFRPSVTV